jgi:hypothetical protein
VDDADFYRWYGDWEPLDLAGLRALMAGFDRPWWVIGGWSIELFTGVSREHDDLDVSIFSRDAPAFRAHLGDAWTPWTAGDVAPGAIQPFDDEFPEVLPDGQLWLRRDARSPWVLDLPLTPDTEGRWTNKRFPSQHLPLDDVTWWHDDVRVLRPEVTLLMKARLARPKDRADLDATWPLLDDVHRTWLQEMLGRVHPGHEWITLLGDRPPP